MEDKDLSDFEAMLTKDLNARVSETSTKFSFDFFAEEPLQDKRSHLTWEKNDAPIKSRPICRLEPKPKMNLFNVDLLPNSKNADQQKERTSNFSKKNLCNNEKNLNETRVSSGQSTLNDGFFN